jgi:hypothetical protein
MRGPRLDADKGLLYVAVGNPAPDFFGGVRMGKNLYTAAMIVLDARSGKLQWFRQFVPHDQHDRSQHLAQRLRVQRPGKLPAVDGDRERRPTVPVRPESGQRRELLRVENDRDLDRPGG